MNIDKRKWRCLIRSHMINFFIIQMDIFHMLSDQLAKNQTDLIGQKCEVSQSSRLIRRRQSSQESQHKKQHQPTPLESVHRLKKWAFIYHKFFMYFYIVEITRFLIIDLLSLEALQDYQLLDCFILGRFRFIGRTNKISSRTPFVAISIFGVYRILAFNVLVPPWKHYFLEFLMYDEKQVVLEEMKFEARATETFSTISEELSSKSTGYLYLPHNVYFNPVFYLKSPFRLVDETGRLRPKVTHRDEWILRPNRTSKNWRFLETFTQFVIYGSIAILFGWIALISWAIGGAIVTDIGFELSYPSCASWIQREQRAANLSLQMASSTGLTLQLIYIAPPVLAGQMNIDDIPAIIPLIFLGPRASNAYHTTRIILDIINNQCWWIDFIFFACCVSYLMLVSSLDVALNAAEIHRRLSALVTKLNRFYNKRTAGFEFNGKLQELDQEQDKSIYQDNTYLPLIKRCCGRNPLEQRDEVELSEEIATIQAILADHFNIVHACNQYISLTMTMVLISWCNYSLIMCIWIWTVHSRAVEIEFLIAEICVTFLTLLFFSGAAMARTLNYRLYSLIADAMALDDVNSATKLRWIKIIKFYWPNSKYCFTMIGHAEISSLFCLQFVWWILSAYIVLTKFFYDKRD